MLLPGRPQYSRTHRPTIALFAIAFRLLTRLTAGAFGAKQCHG